MPRWRVNEVGWPLSIQLLGKPSLLPVGAAGAPRGRKTWGILAYLLCRGGRVSREELAALLFGEANDPMGAVRWNLAEIRRALRDRGCLHGNEVDLELPPGTYVDVHVLLSGSWMQALEVPGLGRELLEGFAFAGHPAFEAWLLNERRHLQAAAEAALREAALARLSGGRRNAAIDLAARLVSLNPLDESSQGLLIRAYAASGDLESAHRQMSACIALFRKELGLEPGEAVLSAASAGAETPPGNRISSRPAARALLEAGENAVNAGALDAGLQCLRRAAAAAEACGDVALKAKSLTAVGGALIYAARGRDEEGAAALHEVIHLADEAGDPPLAASAYRELAALETLRGRYHRARVLLAKAAELAAGDAEARASILVVLGSGLVETGDYRRGLDCLTMAIRHFEKIGDEKSLANALSEAGRGYLLLNELPAAGSALARAANLARELALTSLLPYPESLLAEVRLNDGDPDGAADLFEHAYALGSHLEDPCYEALAGRGLGLVAEAHGDSAEAVTRMEQASARCAFSPDASLWVLGYALDALCSVAIRAGIGQAARWVNDLEALAGRTGMRELLVRAYLHRNRMGETAALSAARLLAGQVSNQHLAEAVERDAALVKLGLRTSSHGDKVFEAAGSGNRDRNLPEPAGEA